MGYRVSTLVCYDEVMKRPGVGIGVFVVKDGKFLMIKRAGAHGSGTWSVPGGWMELGESFQRTAEREVKEEVDLSISDIHFGGVTNTVFKDENIHSVTIWLVSKYTAGQAKIMEPDKSADLLWCDLTTLPKPLFKPWNELLNSQFIPNIQQLIRILNK